MRGPAAGSTKLLLCFASYGGHRIDGAVKVTLPPSWDQFVELVISVAVQVVGPPAPVPPELHMSYYDSVGEKCTIFEASYAAFVEDSLSRRASGELPDMKVAVALAGRPTPPRARTAPGSAGSARRRRRHGDGARIRADAPRPPVYQKPASAGSRPQHQQVHDHRGYARSMPLAHHRELLSSDSGREHAASAPVVAASAFSYSSTNTVGHSATSAGSQQPPGAPCYGAPHPRVLGPHGGGGLEAVNVGRPHPNALADSGLATPAAGRVQRDAELSRAAVTQLERQQRRLLLLSRREDSVLAAIRAAEGMSRASVQAEEDVARRAAELRSARLRPSSAKGGRDPRPGPGGPLAAPSVPRSAGVVQYVTEGDRYYDGIPPRRPAAPRSAPPTRRVAGMPVGLPPLPHQPARGASPSPMRPAPPQQPAPPPAAPAWGDPASAGGPPPGHSPAHSGPGRCDSPAAAARQSPPPSQPTPPPQAQPPQMDAALLVALQQVEWEEQHDRRRIVEEHRSERCCDIDAAISRLWLRCTLARWNSEIQAESGSPPPQGRHRSSINGWGHRGERDGASPSPRGEQDGASPSPRGERDGASPSPREARGGAAPVADQGDPELPREAREETAAAPSRRSPSPTPRSPRSPPETAAAPPVRQSNASSSSSGRGVAASAMASRPPEDAHRPPSRHPGSGPKRAFVVAPGEAVPVDRVGSVAFSEASRTSLLCTIGSLNMDQLPQDWPAEPQGGAPPIHPLLQAAMPFLLWPVLRAMPPLSPDAAEGAEPALPPSPVPTTASAS